MNKPVIWKGIVAGCAGGMVAACAMGLAYGVALKVVSKLVGPPPPHESRSEDSTVRVARALAEPILHRKLSAGEADRAGPLVHYGFGSSIGLAYGIAAELAPVLTRGAGLPLGGAAWLGAHVIAVPALGLARPITQSPAPSEVAEFVAHLIFGGVTEMVRSGLRRLLG